VRRPVSVPGSSRNAADLPWPFSPPSCSGRSRQQPVPLPPKDRRRRRRMRAPRRIRKKKIRKWNEEDTRGRGRRRSCNSAPRVVLSLSLCSAAKREEKQKNKKKCVFIWSFLQQTKRCTKVKPGVGFLSCVSFVVGTGWSVDGLPSRFVFDTFLDPFCSFLLPSFHHFSLPPCGCPIFF